MKLEIKNKLSQLNDLKFEISDLQFKIEKLEKKVSLLAVLKLLIENLLILSIIFQ